MKNSIVRYSLKDFFCYSSWLTCNDCCI